VCNALQTQAYRPPPSSKFLFVVHTAISCWKTVWIIFGLQAGTEKQFTMSWDFSEIK
jgi:hypothetical protein